VRDRRDQAALDGRAGQRALAPVRDRQAAGLGRLAGQGQDGADLLRGEGRWRPRPRGVGQPLGQHQVGLGAPAAAPQAHRLDRDPQPARTLPVAGPVGRQQDDPGAQSQLLGRRMRPDQIFQLPTLIRPQYQGLQWPRHGSLPNTRAVKIIRRERR
jgi:hypothetical protein